MRFVGLGILFLAVLIGIFFYDRKERSKRKQILHQLWKIASKTDTIIGMPVRKLKIMENLDMPAMEFAAQITKLANDGIVKREMDSIEFTEYGLQYYEFKVKPDHRVRPDRNTRG